MSMMSWGKGTEINKGRMDIRSIIRYKWNAYLTRSVTMRTGLCVSVHAHIRENILTENTTMQTLIMTVRILPRCSAIGRTVTKIIAMVLTRITIASTPWMTTASCHAMQAYPK
jgi:hypothetical protein